MHRPEHFFRGSGLGGGFPAAGGRRPVTLALADPAELLDRGGRLGLGLDLCLDDICTEVEARVEPFRRTSEVGGVPGDGSLDDRAALGLLAGADGVQREDGREGEVREGGRLVEVAGREGRLVEGAEEGHRLGQVPDREVQAALDVDGGLRDVELLGVLHGPNLPQLRVVCT